MNNEIYAADYTAEEQASPLWQSSSPVIHAQLETSDGYATEDAHSTTLAAVTDARQPKVQKRYGYVSVRYIRSDLYDDLADRLQKAEAALAASPLPPEAIYLIVGRSAGRGGKPVAFHTDEEGAWLFAELYSGDEGGREYDVRKIPLAVPKLEVKP